MPAAKSTAKAGTTAKATVKKKAPPKVVMSTRGMMNDILEAPVEALREANPDKEYRWVYAPEGSSDFSKFTQKRVQGYRPVSVTEVEVEGFGHSGDYLRVGDVVLMEIDKDTWEARGDFLRQQAIEAAQRPHTAFEQGLAEQSKGKTTPMGGIKKTATEHQLNLPTEE